MTFLPGWATLKAYLPNGTLFKDYSGDDSLELEFSDQVNGGYFDSSFKLCDYYNRTPDYGYIIEIRDEEEDVCLFRGLSQRPEFDVGNSARITAIGHGNPEGSCSFKRDWGLGNQIPSTGKQIWPTGTPITTLFTESLTMCQQIVAGTWVSLSGLQLTQETRDYNGQSPYDLWQEIAAWFAGFSTPLIWVVRDFAGTNALYLSYADTSVRLTCVWDNDTVKIQDNYNMRGTVNQSTVRYGNGRRKISPSTGIRSHAVLPANNDIDKYVSLDNEIRGDADAQALADLYMTRVNTRKPENGTITLCGANVTAKPPIVDGIIYPTGRSSYPVHLIQSGWVIQTQDLPPGQAPFDVEEHWITAVRYRFDNDTMVLTTGEVVSLSSEVKRISTYMTSLGAIATQQASYSVPEFHPQATPVYGPQSVGTLPATNDNQIGLASFKLNDQFTNTENQLLLPHKAGIDPSLVPDYGTQANFGREADSVGLKGFIRLIPVKVLTWEVCFLPPAGSSTVPTQDMTIKLYDNYPITGANLIHTIIISNKQCDNGNIPIGSPTDHRSFAQGGKLGIEVTAVGASNVAGSGFIIGVGGRKLYPDLGVTS